MKLDKEYEATLRLGATSTTGDPEGEITALNCKKVDQKAIADALQALQGEIMQTPPIYSAIKVNGQRAYKLAREGKEVVLEPRKVTIYSLEIENYEYPELKIIVKCSSGTYIRTLAEDIGKGLGCGAYLTALRRTKIGEFEVKDGLNIDAAISNLEAIIT